MTDLEPTPEPEKPNVEVHNYTSVSQMPDELKGLFKDSDNNGVPDLFEDSSVTQKIVVQGKEYANWNDVPEEFRSIGGKLDFIKKVYNLNQSQETVLSQPTNTANEASSSIPLWVGIAEKTNNGKYFMLLLVVVIALLIYRGTNFPGFFSF